MKAVIVGCGRVGALLAAALDEAGHEVAIIDTSTLAFERLPETFHGNAIRGNGTDEEVLRRAGTDHADLFLAVTEGDNRNVMAAQLAAEVFNATRVIAKINDPVRAEAYADLGIATICRTTMLADAISAYMGLPVTESPAVRPPRGQHPGAEHEPMPGAVDESTESGPAGPGATSVPFGPGLQRSAREA